MTNAAYTAGFMDKLAGYIKSAKSYSEMTPEERNISDRRFAEHEKRREDNIVKQDPLEEAPRSFTQWAARIPRNSWKQTKSWGRGLTSAAGVAALRAGEGMANMAVWIPELTDKMIMGGVMGVDNGRGLMGRHMGKFHRWMDSNVDAVRRWSSDYDYKHRIDSKFNRFMQGTAADTAGAFLGFGGLQGMASRGAGRLFGLGMATWGAHDAATGEGQYKQLRDREAMIRKLDPKFWQYTDPTATAYNQENAYTPEEYRRFHVPSTGVPTSYSGYAKIPWSWGHDSQGMPTQFREYGT